MSASHRDAVVLHVRGGEIAEAGSWVYAWLRVDGDRRVVYVGATGLPAEVRTWLHLHDPDPDVGRLIARYPVVGTQPLDVIAVEIPDGESRQNAKALLAAALAKEGFLSKNYIGDDPGAATVHESTAHSIDAIVAYVREHIAA